jgi:hypothetical protein
MKNVLFFKSEVSWRNYKQKQKQKQDNKKKSFFPFTLVIYIFYTFFHFLKKTFFVQTLGRYNKHITAVNDACRAVSEWRHNLECQLLS